MLRIEICKRFAQAAHGEAHYVEVVAVDAGDECGSALLDSVSAGFVVGGRRVEVRFDSQGFYGWQFKRVRLYTSADVSPLTIYVEAEVE